MRRGSRPRIAVLAFLAAGACGCGRLDTAREPVVAPHEHRPYPVVQLRRATLPQPLTVLAVHYWFTAWDPDQREWHRWEVWQDREQNRTSWGHVHRDLISLDGGVGGGPSLVERQWYGEEARRLLVALAASPSYPDRDVYRAWPGPNSNTYVAWVLREARVSADLNPKAIGKDWRGWIGAGLTTTGAGIQFSTPLVGLKLGFVDGVEVSVLCLTFGWKVDPLALKTPLGSLGFPEQ